MMKKSEYIKLLKVSIETKLDNLTYLENESLSILKMELDRANDIGSIIMILSEMAYNVPSILKILIELLVEDISNLDFINAPTHYDT